MDHPGRPFIWNGIGLSPAQGFEPVTLDTDFFRLADDAGREIAVRLSSSLPADDHASLVRVLKKRLSGLSPNFDEDALPASLLSAAWNRQDDESGVIVAPFIGKEDADPLYGAALAFSGSGRTIVALCNGGSPDKILDDAVTCIHDLKDLSLEEPVPWAVFDVRFAVLQEAVYTRSFFRPGHYKISFALGDSTLAFEFLGPAEILLKDKMIGDWAMKHFVLQEEPRLKIVDASKAFDARFEPEERRRRLPSLRKKKALIVYAHARESGSNKIICCSLSGLPNKEPGLSEADFNAICREAKHVP